MTSRSFTISIVASAAIACSTVRYTPPPDSFRPPRLEYPVLRGRSVELTVMDHRGDRQESDSLVKVTRDDLAKALTQAGVRIARTSDSKLEVRITGYRADFEMAEWNGCVRLNATLEAPPRPRSELPVERCVKKSNMSGYGSGDDALHQAYSDAMSELLSRVDQLR